MRDLPMADSTRNPYRIRRSHVNPSARRAWLGRAVAAWVWKACGVSELSAWRVWWRKRRWYERNRRPLRRLRIHRHMARRGAYARFPIEGEVLEALDSDRLAVGEGTLLEPGCWLTLAPEATIEIGAGCFLNRNTMLAAHERIEIGDHTMFANGCFVVNCAVTSGVTIGERCVIGANSVVTKDLPPRTIAAGAPARAIREID